MTANELRKKYLDFFSAKGHKIIPSAFLVPDETDPTVLFTTAGMHPLVPYLMGEKHPKGKRLVNVQKCVRTGDIDDVGDNTHNTFFEMLGNWSLGDYFKEDSIRWSWEFLTDKKWLGISPEKIKVTVFEGDSDAPRDGESTKIWQECFEKSNISSEVYDKEKGNNETARIFPLPKKDNWWGPAGYQGACGSDTEIFIDLGRPVNFEKCPDHKNCKPGCSCGRYVEIWNNVFMDKEGLRTVKLKEESTKKNIELPKEEYDFFEDEKRMKYKLLSSNVKILEDLPNKNIDTGMGLERMLAVLNGLDNVYETELFAPIVERIQNLEKRTLTPTPASPVRFAESRRAGRLSQRERGNKKSYRIIADHIKASVFIIMDGEHSSNVGRGYVLRRLIRRAVRHGKILGIEKNFTKQIAGTVIDIYKETYPEVEENKEKIFAELEKEEEKFRQLLIKNEVVKNKQMQLLYDCIFKEIALKSGLSKEQTEDLLQKDGIPSSTVSLSANIAFDLETTRGYPHDLFFDDLREVIPGADKSMSKIEKEFEKKLKKHQQLSRTAGAGKFKGGLADGGEEVKKLHTATHLLLAALRKVLGDHIFQKGSNITAERLRFDFSHSEKLSDEQIKKVENLVNEQIKKDLLVSFEEVSLDEARKIGAIGVFEAKYGDKVKVYTIGPSAGSFGKLRIGSGQAPSAGSFGKLRTGSGQAFSCEICGGPHAEKTGELGHFKIKKEQSSGAGVRRIKAVLE